MPKQPGRPRKPRKTQNQEENPQIHAGIDGLVPEQVKTEKSEKVERGAVVLPSDYRSTGCTYHGEPVYQRWDGQLVIASGQYVRKSKLDQKFK